MATQAKRAGTRSRRPSPAPRTDDQISLDLFESLRRIALAVSSDLELEGVLQSIVDAVCDHTEWQLCWINELHLARGYAEVVARRDKLEYTTRSRRLRWDLEKSPSMEAVRQNRPIAIPDIPACRDYPDYCEDAAVRGGVAGVMLPLTTSDVADAPRVLCVQSTLPLLGDSRQLPFLRTVAGMASLAVRNARQVYDSRRALLTVSEASAVLTSALHALAAGASAADLYSQLELRTDTSLVVLNQRDRLCYVGRSPVPHRMDDEAWRKLVEESVSALVAAVPEPRSDGGPSTNLSAGLGLGLPENVHAHLTRLAGSPSLGAVLSVARSEEGGSAHETLCSAVGMVLLRDQVRLDTELQLNADTLVALFSEEAEADCQAVAERASYFGIDLTTANMIAAVPIPEHTPMPRLQRAVFAARHFAANWPGTTAHTVQSHLVLVIPREHFGQRRFQSALRALRTGLADDLDIPAVAWAGPCEQLSDYPRAWSECLLAVDLAHKLGRSGVVTLADFGSYRFLLSALTQDDIDTFITAKIGAVLAHDAEHHSDLFETVEAFVVSGGRFQETARRLHIHVSTLRYRLDKLATLVGCDLADDDVRFEVSLAVRLHRLRSG